MTATHRARPTLGRGLVEGCGSTEAEMAGSRRQYRLAIERDARGLQATRPKRAGSRARSGILMRPARANSATDRQAIELTRRPSASRRRRGGRAWRATAWITVRPWTARRASIELKQGDRTAAGSNCGRRARHIRLAAAGRAIAGARFRFETDPAEIDGSSRRPRAAEDARAHVVAAMRGGAGMRWGHPNPVGSGVLADRARAVTAAIMAPGDWAFRRSVVAGGAPASSSRGRSLRQSAARSGAQIPT